MIPSSSGHNLQNPPPDESLDNTSTASSSSSLDTVLEVTPAICDIQLPSVGEENSGREDQEKLGVTDESCVVDETTSCCVTLQEPVGAHCCDKSSVNLSQGCLVAESNSLEEVQDFDEDFKGHSGRNPSTSDKSPVEEQKLGYQRDEVASGQSDNQPGVSQSEHVTTCEELSQLNTDGESLGVISADPQALSGLQVFQPLGHLYLSGCQAIPIYPQAVTVISTVGASQLSTNPSGVLLGNSVIPTNTAMTSNNYAVPYALACCRDGELDGFYGYGHTGMPMYGYPVKYSYSDPATVAPHLEHYANSDCSNVASTFTVNCQHPSYYSPDQEVPYPDEGYSKPYYGRQGEYRQSYNNWVAAEAHDKRRSSSRGYQDEHPASVSYKAPDCFCCEPSSEYPANSFVNTSEGCFSHSVYPAFSSSYSNYPANNNACRSNGCYETPNGKFQRREAPVWHQSTPHEYSKPASSSFLGAEHARAKQHQKDMENLNQGFHNNMHEFSNFKHGGGSVGMYYYQPRNTYKGKYYADLKKSRYNSNIPTHDTGYERTPYRNRFDKQIFGENERKHASTYVRRASSALPSSRNNTAPTNDNRRYESKPPSTSHDRGIPRATVNEWSDYMTEYAQRYQQAGGKPPSGKYSHLHNTPSTPECGGHQEDGRIVADMKEMFLSRGYVVNPNTYDLETVRGQHAYMNFRNKEVGKKEPQPNDRVKCVNPHAVPFVPRDYGYSDPAKNVTVCESNGDISPTNFNAKVAGNTSDSSDSPLPQATPQAMTSSMHGSSNAGTYGTRSNNNGKTTYNNSYERRYKYKY